MRWVLALLLLTLATACRRSPPPEAVQPTPVAESPEAVSPPAASERDEPALADRQPSPVAPAQDEVPAPAALPDAPPAPAAEEPEDGAIYTWTDAGGVVHFGGADEIPDDLRASARSVRDDVTVMEAVSLDLPPAPPPPEPAAIAAPVQDQEPVRANEPGDVPELDADGLPIPGTMKETSHTRAVRRATGVQLDPASVERQYQQQLRDMKCVEKDGVITCG